MMFELGGRKSRILASETPAPAATGEPFDDPKAAEMHDVEATEPQITGRGRKKKDAAAAGRQWEP